jgi:hypothetical protein
MDSISLTRAHRKISDYMAQHQPGMPVNLAYVDRARGTVLVGVPDIGPSMLACYRRVLHDMAGGAPLTFVRCCPAVRHGKKTERNRPLVGGLLVACLAADSSGAICIGATRHGSPGFVTAGHVAMKKGNVFYQPGRGPGNKVGAAEVVSAYKTKATSDSAFIPTARTGAKVRACSIWKDGNSAYYTVTGAAEPPAKDTDVFMQGPEEEEERAGQIAAQDVTVTFERGGVLEHQILATYASREGDSGAPVYLKDSDSDVRLVGLNVGVTDPEHVTPSPPAGSQYAIISPWACIASELHVTL